jgi:hypothetical protein
MFLIPTVPENRRSANEKLHLASRLPHKHPRQRHPIKTFKYNSLVQYGLQPLKISTPAGIGLIF